MQHPRSGRVPAGEGGGPARARRRRHARPAPTRAPRPAASLEGLGSGLESPPRRVRGAELRRRGAPSRHLINCSIWHLLVTNLCSSSPMSSLLTIHSHRLQMKCECPKGKRAFAEVRSATAPPGGSACAGRRVMPTTPTGYWSCLSATWTTWDVAAYPKESTKRAFESLSDNFSQDSLMSF